MESAPALRGALIQSVRHKSRSAPLNVPLQYHQTMARVFLIFSILIGLGAAFFGFKAKTQAEALQEDLRTQKSNLETTKGSLKKAEAEVAAVKKDLDAAKSEAEAKAKEAADAKAAEDKAKADLAKAVAEVEDKNKKIAEMDAAVASLKKEMGDVNPAELAAKIKDLTDAKAKMETELAEATQLRDTFDKKAKEAEAQFAAKDRTIQEYKAGYVRNGLTGKVLAYNPGWNFVVLNLGDKSGLKSGVQMVVTRSGAMVGKVKVTTVEPNTAIADVLPGTIARGDAVQPGDTVVFEGAR